MRPIQVHGHTRPLTQITYNKDGDLLFTCARDKVPNVFYSHNGERLGTYNGHKGAVNAIAVNSHSDRLLTADSDNTVLLWDVETGNQIKKYEFQTAARGVGFGLGDRLCLVLTDVRKGYTGALSIYQVGEETPVQSIVLNGSRATCAKWGALNEVIFTGHEDGTIQSWEPKTGKLLKTIKAHSGPVTDLQMSQDLSYFITSSKDTTAKIFDAYSLEEKRVYQTDRPLNSACLSPIYEQVILGGGQDARDVTTTSAREGRFEICFYHRIYANEIGRVKGHFGPVNTLAFHPNGKSFSSGGEDGYVRIHHFDSDYFDFDYEL